MHLFTNLRRDGDYFKKGQIPILFYLDRQSSLRKYHRELRILLALFCNHAHGPAIDKNSRSVSLLISDDDQCELALLTSREEEKQEQDGKGGIDHVRNARRHTRPLRG